MVTFAFALSLSLFAFRLPYLLTSYYLLTFFAFFWFGLVRALHPYTRGTVPGNGNGAVAHEQLSGRHLLANAEFEREATWATRKYVPFVMQRISIAVQIAAASEIRQALGRGLAPYSA